MSCPNCGNSGHIVTLGLLSTMPCPACQAHLIPPQPQPRPPRRRLVGVYWLTVACLLLWGWA